MSRGMLALGAVLVMAAGAGAGGIAAAASSDGACCHGATVTMVGSNFGPQLASSSELQIKGGSITLKAKLPTKGWDGTVKGFTARISVTVPIGAGVPDVVIASTFSITPGQTKPLTIPTTLAQRHAINTKGTGAQTGPSKRTAAIAIEVDQPAKDGSTTVYRYTKTGHITVLKRTAAVSLASTDLELGCSLNSCPNPFGDGSVVSVPLLCAGNPDDNETCSGKVTVTVKQTGKPSVVWSGSYTVPPSPESKPVAMAIKTKGTGADNNRYAATIDITPTSGDGKTSRRRVEVLKSQ